MLHFFIHGAVLADGITIRFGNTTWIIGTNFIVYLLVGAAVGLVAEFLVGWRLPFGIIGAIVAGLIGAWLMTKVIVIGGVSDFTVAGVPVFRALVGAVLLVAVWHLLTYRSWRRRHRYYRGYRE
jgi:uncharacterized membrane protein YeaQ/YmgE (transglycosylase-associated protein family)